MALRAFDVNEDLDKIVPLLQAAFYYPENDNWTLNPEEITSMIDDFTLLRQLQPVLRVVGIFKPALKALMQGYIWEEDGTPVGMVSVSPRGLNNRVWVIGNVAVHPDHRRKGIGRQLIEAALDLARQNRVKTVILEVIADNLPAVKLYENMGFETYSQIVQTHRGAALDLPPLSALPESYALEPDRVRNWKLRYALMNSITPPRVQQYEPVVPKNFRKSPLLLALRWLVMKLAPVKNESVLVRHQATNTVVARTACHLRKKEGGINEIDIYLEPNHAALAPYLVSACLHDTVAVSPGRDIDMRIPGWQDTVLQAALNAGFACRAEGYWMGMHL